jgi:phage gp29-like protein
MPQTPARVPERPVRVDAAHSWLERTNPLVGLSIRTAQNIFDCARAGDTQRLHGIFQEIEAANPILFTCIDRRQSAIAGFRLKVSALPSAEGALADEQKDAVETFLAGIENFTETLEHLDTAFFRGFALAQPIWEENGSVREIALHNSWEFLVHDGVLYHNPECDGFTRSAVPCADAGLIGVQRRRAIDYPALSIHIRHAVSERDWGRFLERYALPKPAVTMAPNATNAQRGDYLTAARAVENGQVSVWPSGSSITDFAGGSRGTDPFKDFIEHQEKLVVLLATGGTLTSLAQADTGSLAGGAQMKVWQEIVLRDADVLSQAVMRSLIKPFLAQTFGARPCSVAFELDFPEERSAQDAANVAATLHQAGWRVDQGELEKAVGFTLEREETAPQPQAFAKAKSSPPLQTTKSALQIAPENPAGQGEGEDDGVLLGAFSAGLEEAMMSAMAKAMVEELEKENRVESE